MKNTGVRKLCVAAMLTAIAVILSAFSIPVGASRCFPIQSLVNVLSAVLLGPWWALGVAFCTSLIRNILGTGTLLAFPGSMIGALLAGLLYQYTHKLTAAYFGELFGTGILGALVAYPIAAFVLKNSAAALFTYVIPFLISSLGGVVVAAVLLVFLVKTKALDHLKTQMAH